MTVLQDFCGQPDLTWSGFWRLEGRCGLTMIGAIVPFVYIFVVWCAALPYWWKSTVKGQGKKGKYSLVANFVRGQQVSEGLDGDHAEPLLAENGAGVSTAYDEDSDEDAGHSLNGTAGTGLAGMHLKKGTGIHWTKLLLYVLQLHYHLGIFLYLIINDPNGSPYKYTSHLILAGAWVLLGGVQTMNYQVIGARHNSWFQAAFPVIFWTFLLWEIIKFNGVGHVRKEQLAAWDLGLVLLIIAFEAWFCVCKVPVKYYRHLNQEYLSGLWSFLHFSWYTPIIDYGYNNKLRTDDLPTLVDDDRAANVWERFSKLLYPRGQAGVREKEPLKVGTNVIKLGGSRYPLQALWAFISALMQLAPPLALHEITGYMEDYDSKAKHGGAPLIVWLCVASLFYAQAIANYADNQMFKLGRRLGVRARSALISAVFRKAMALDMSSASVGQLQNLISVDAEAVLNLMVFQMFMWGAVLRLVACVVLLFWVLGLSAFGGLTLIALTLPINKVLVQKLKQYQLALMKRRDARMSVVNEAISGIRIIKFFAWEENFFAKIVDARKLELVILKAYMLTLGCFMVAVKSSPTIIGLVTFLIHTEALGNDLSAATGFTALALFNALRMPLIVLPDTFNYYIQARVSFKRIEEFLSRSKDDITNEELYGTTGSDRHARNLPPGAARIEEGTFKWRTTGEREPPTLSNIHISVEPGTLTCIFGPTGSGKSSLLMAFLQEMVTLKGRSLMNGTVAYASQRAWIQNATLRDNILFGRPYEHHRYETVLEVCALKPDLEILEAGDMTEIGEKGVNLSGGQQQRVSLARAVYSDAQIILLDDVLSAVDAHVGKHIFDKCIRGFLRHKTRILVTHQVSLTARYADQLVVLNMDGTIRDKGTYETLAAEGDSRLAEVVGPAGAGGPRLLRRSSSSYAPGDVDDKNPEKTVVSKKIVEEEKSAVGRPKLALYLSYFRSCGGLWFGVAWVGFSGLWQALTVAQSLYLRNWINELDVDIHQGPGFRNYIITSVASIVVLLIRTVLMTWGSLEASKTVHNNMAKNVFGAPISWYDSTPLGRVFNRFSSDVNTLDKDLMNDISSYLDSLLGVLGVVAVIAAAVPILTVGMVPVLGLCIYYANRYLQTSRQLKRLEAVNKSPLYAHFAESVSGVVTVRAYEAQQRFIRTSEGHANNLNRSHLYLWCSNYWLTNRVRMIGSLVCGLVGCFLVAQVRNIDGSTSGLVITYALNFTISVVFTVRLHAQMEMSVNSIERLDEYTQLEQEAPPIIEDRRPPKSWPLAGEVNIKNMTLRYASSSDPVLHNVSFRVPPKSRLGIVGRTGAGKSSLMNALFRIVEPQPGSVIEVDGINILTMGLKDLRRSLSIIPQEPTLFQGTVRTNVDPFNDHSDADIWQSLRQCRLADYISSTEEKLEHPIADGGANLSVGQRQLMCMARAILRRAAVMVMDEATANVDPETDAAIQDTMRDGFSDCTVLCIAHRLQTVVFYDLILVLERGEVAEYDSPRNLLRNKDSRFYKMCEQTGDLANLIKIAEGMGQNGDHATNGVETHDIR